MTEHIELDVRGLNSPLPILRIRETLKEMKSGEVLQVIISDPGSVRDIESFCNQTSNTLLPSTKVDGEYIFFIRKH